MTSVSINEQDHWSLGFVRMFTRGPSVVGSKEVDITCRKMYQNRMEGMFPKQIEDLDAKISEVVHKFSQIYTKTCLNQKIRILSLAFFKEISEFEEPIFPHLYKKEINNISFELIFEAAQGRELLKHAEAKLFLSNYFLCSSKDISWLLLELYNCLPKKIQNAYETEAKRSHASLYEAILNKKISLEDIKKYYCFLENKQVQGIIPESLVDLHDVYINWEKKYFIEHSALFWKVRIELLKRLCESIQ